MVTLSDKIEPKGMTDFGNDKIGHIAVADIKKFLILIQDKIISDQGATDYIQNGSKLIDFIQEKAGKRFVLSEDRE